MKLKKVRNTTQRRIVSMAIVFASFSVVADNPAINQNKVIISAKAPVDAGAFAGSVTVIDAEQIQNSGASSVVELLESSPSVQMVVTGNHSAKAPQLRGQLPERTLVLVNGKRVPNTDRNLPFGPALRFNWVPIANIERVEIIRGPASSLYGADAMAGVINIITHQATRKWQGSYSLVGKKLDDHDNGGDLTAGSVGFSTPLSERSDLVVAIEQRDDDAIVDDRGLTVKSSKKQTNLQADLGIDIHDDDRLQFGVLYGEEEGSDVDQGFRGITNTDIDVERHRVTADYSTRIGGFTSDFGVLASNADIQEGSAIWEVQENSVNADFQGEINSQHYLSFGVLHRQEEVQRSDRVVFNDEIDATLLYVQDVVAVSDSSHLTLGVAYDVHSKYDNEVSPKLYFTQQLSDSMGIKLGYGESYLAPSLREGSSNYVVPAGPTRVYVGNDDLQPESGKTVELGVNWNRKNSRGALTLFRSEIDDLIGITNTTNGSGVTTAQYNNIDESLIQGLEAEWSVNNSANTSRFNVHYTWLDTENQSGRFKGNQLTNRADHAVKLTYAYQWLQPNLTFETAFQYTGDQYTDNANTQKIDSYSVYDLALVKPLSKKLNLRFAVENVGDEMVFDDGELIEAGRAFKLTLSGKL